MNRNKTGLPLGCVNLMVECLGIASRSFKPDEVNVAMVLAGLGYLEALPEDATRFRATDAGRRKLASVCKRCGAALSPNGHCHPCKEDELLLKSMPSDFLNLRAAFSDPAPDANCLTTLDGGCVGGPCMHDPKKEDGMTKEDLSVASANEFKNHAEIIWRTALSRTREERDYSGFTEAHAHLEDTLHKYDRFDMYTRDGFQFAVALMWRDALKVPEVKRKKGFVGAVAYFEAHGWKPLL